MSFGTSLNKAIVVRAICVQNDAVARRLTETVNDLAVFV